MFTALRRRSALVLTAILIGLAAAFAIGWLAANSAADPIGKAKPRPPGTPQSDQVTVVTQPLTVGAECGL